MPSNKLGFFARHLREPDDLRQRVCLNLDRFLNTRRGDLSPGADRRVEATLLGYGMPDLSRVDPADPASRRSIAEAIARLVRLWEPRLADVEVTPAAEGPGGILRFRIEGRWAGGEVGFDARLERPVRFTLERMS